MFNLGCVDQKSTLNKSTEKNTNILIFGKLRGQIDPTKVFNPSVLGIAGCIFDSIISIDKGGNFKGELVKSWFISKDNKEYHFELKDLKFSDGVVFNSDHVKESIVNYLSETSHGIHKSLFGNLLNKKEWFKKVSEKQFIIKLKAPYPDFLHLLSLPELSVFRYKNGSLLGTSYYHIANLDSESFLLKSRNDELMSVEMLYGNFEIFKKNDISSYDYLLGVPPVWLQKIKIPKTHKISLAKRYNIQSLQLNPKKNLFESNIFREDLFKVFRWIRKSHIIKLNNIFLTYDRIVPRGLLAPQFYNLSNIKYMGPDKFIEKWGHHIKKNSGLKIWIPEGYFEDEFLEKIVEAFKPIKGFTLYTDKYWMIAELFKKDKIDISAVDSGVHLPNLDGLLSVWKANQIPGFPFPGQKLVDMYEQGGFSVTNSNMLTQIKRLEEQSWILPLFSVARTVIAKRELNLFDQEFSLQNVVCN